MKLNVSRRRFMQISAGIGSLASMPGLVWPAATKHTNPLPIPRLMTGDKANGNRNYRLNVQYGSTEFFSGYETPTLGFSGNYLGPTLRIKKGDKVKINVTNSLDEITTVHWHGMILPARMDGGPHQKIAPGESWRSEFAVRQPAATLFYHSHAHGNTGQQVYRGLAGLIIVDDDESMQAGLPAEYGVDDIPVIMQDRSFGQNGSFLYLAMMPERMIGKHGKTLLVNGAISTVFKAQKSLLRLRLVNASNARFYNLVFSDGRPFQVIASDGGLLERPVTVNQLPVAPAERFEILLDVSDKKSVMLQSIGGVGNASHGPMGMMGMDKHFDVLWIDAGQVKSERSVIPKQLTSYPDWSQVSVATRRPVELQMGMGGMMGGMMGGNSAMAGGMMKINNRSFDMQRIDFAIKKDSFEIWDVGNKSPMIHPFHVHNTQFRVLSRNGKKPSALENGFKDTVVVNSNEMVRIMVPTGPYADDNHAYMYHCHILEHEDGGMMGQFLVKA